MRTNKKHKVDILLGILITNLLWAAMLALCFWIPCKLVSMVLHMQAISYSFFFLLLLVTFLIASMISYRQPRK